jgi:hypothetical protein
MNIENIPEGQDDPDSATTAKRLRCPNCRSIFDREDFGIPGQRDHKIGCRYECPECGLQAEWLRYPDKGDSSFYITFDPRDVRPFIPSGDDDEFVGGWV